MKITMEYFTVLTTTLQEMTNMNLVADVANGDVCHINKRLTN